MEAQDLLAGALPLERGLERRFKDWITAAHRDLDKSTRFENMASNQEQVRGRPCIWEGGLSTPEGESGRGGGGGGGGEREEGWRDGRIPLEKGLGWEVERGVE